MSHLGTDLKHRAPGPGTGSCPAGGHFPHVQAQTMPCQTSCLEGTTLLTTDPFTGAGHTRLGKKGHFFGGEIEIIDPATEGFDPLPHTSLSDAEKLRVVEHSGSGSIHGGIHGGTAREQRNPSHASPSAQRKGVEKGWEEKG